MSDSIDSTRLSDGIVESAYATLIASLRNPVDKSIVWHLLSDEELTKFQEAASELQKLKGQIRDPSSKVFMVKDPVSFFELRKAYFKWAMFHHFRNNLTLASKVLCVHRHTVSSALKDNEPCSAHSSSPHAEDQMDSSQPSDQLTTLPRDSTV